MNRRPLYALVRTTLRAVWYWEHAALHRRLLIRTAMRRGRGSEGGGREVGADRMLPRASRVGTGSAHSSDTSLWAIVVLGAVMVAVGAGVFAATARGRRL